MSRVKKICNYCLFAYLGAAMIVILRAMYAVKSPSTLALLAHGVAITHHSGGLGDLFHRPFSI